MKKFWVVHNIAAPYRLNIFNAMWEECKARGLDFHVHFMSDMSRGYDERCKQWLNPDIDFPHTYWKDFGVWQCHFNPGLLWRIWRDKPEYLLVGSSFYTVTGMFAGRLTNGVTSTWCEGNTKTPGKMGGLAGAMKRFALAGYKYVAVPGSDSAKYIAMHQARTKRQLAKPITLPNLVDESRFRYVNAGIRSEVKRAIIPARLSPVKGLLEFIGLLTPEMLVGWKLVIVGNGELREQILKMISDRGLSDYIEIHPFVPYNEMPNYYIESDLLILPSIYDPNPLAVAEALHCGLAIALSSEAGNVEEAVAEGKNGWVLPVKDRGRFAEVLKDVFSASSEKLAEMGKWSLNHNAKFWDTKESISRFVDAIVER